MWTAREEGWEKDERSVKEERDAVGVMIESSYSLVRLATLCVCVCVCSVTFLQVCAYVWVGVEVCTFQLTSAFTCACVWAWLCVSMCLCAFRCVSVISCMSYIQLGQITLFSNDHTTTILYFWSLAPNPPLDSFSNLELRANNLPLCFMNPFTIQEG